jgi:D-inositol-3-phosphate glycosyltransferase
MTTVAHVLRKLDASAWGGTETHVQAITERLAALGHTSEVHAPEGPSSPSRLNEHTRVRRFRAYNPFIASRETRAGLWSVGGNILSIELLRRLAADRSLDLAHLHTLGRVGGAARTAMLFTGRPYVLSIHGLLLSDPARVADETASRMGSAIDCGKPVGALLGARRVLDDAAAVLCFNDDERTALERRVGSRAVRMEHGVDRARFEGGSRASALARWPALSAARSVLVQVGRVCAQKNQRFTVRALAGLPSSVSLALVGAETDQGYRAQVEADARALGVADRVHWLGNLSDRAALADAYALADVVLAPSTHEAFGLVVLEAWAAGKPALFARSIGLRDLAARLADDSCALSLDEPSVWSDAIARVLASVSRRRALVAEGQRLVLARHDWREIASRLEALYARVVEDRARAVRPARAGGVR